MDSLIAKISEIESSSKQIMEKAGIQKSQIADNMKQMTERFDLELEQETKQQLDQLAKQLKEDLEQKLAQQKQLTDQTLQAMDQHYESCHRAYVDRLFKQMTGVSYHE